MMHAEAEEGIAKLTLDRTAAVVGGGPAGLLSAIMLARRGWRRVDVFDELPAPPPPGDICWRSGERSYQLGINGRGQNALRRFGCLERVEEYAASVRGRLSFPRNGPPVASILKPPGTPGAEKKYVTRVLQRDRLLSCLLEEARSYPQIHIQHEVACEDIDLHSAKPTLTLGGGTTCGPVDLVIGADGVRSVVRDAIVEAPGSRTRFIRFEDANERRYKTFPMHPDFVPGTRADLNWGAGNRDMRLGMDALPTKEGGLVGVLLLVPGSTGFQRVEQLQSAEDARQFFEDALPQLLPFLEDDELGRFAARNISRLPCFHLVEGDVHRELDEGAVILLGDSIKAVKPYFGQGCNSALEDVDILARCLEEAQDKPKAAAAHFTQLRAEDARALVRLSRSFDHPGPLGTARFVVPLLLDRQLSQLLPSVFTPPLLRAIQDEKYTFAGLWRRKRYERVAFAAMLFAGVFCFRALVRLVWRLF